MDLEEAGKNPLYGVHQDACKIVGGRSYRRPLARVSVFGEVYEVVRHPLLLVTDTVTAWLEDYLYTQEYKVPIPWVDRHNCWVQAKKIYEEVKRSWQIKQSGRN